MITARLSNAAILPVIMVAGIVGGFATPTEAGSLAIVYPLFIELQWLPRAFGLERYGSSLADGANYC